MNDPEINCISIVDRDPGWLSFAKRILTDEGYYVTAASNINDCYAELLLINSELVLVDYDRFKCEKELFISIAKLQAMRGQQIVLMSPIELPPEIIGEAFKHGANDFVEKQYSKSQFIYSIQKILKEKENYRPLVKRAYKYFNNDQYNITDPQEIKSLILSILIVEDEEDWIKVLKTSLYTDIYQIKIARDYHSAIRFLEEYSFNILILDLRLIEDGEDFEGMELLKYIKEQQKELEVIIISAYGSSEHAIEGYKTYNISDFIPKRIFDSVSYRDAVSQAFNRQLR